MEDHESKAMNNIHGNSNSSNSRSSSNEYSISEFLNEMPSNLSGVSPASLGHLWVFWMEDCEESESFQILTSTSLSDNLSTKVKIVYALRQLAFLTNQITLLQFWAPKLMNGQNYLTTSDQPFALTKLHKGLCSYRKQCLNYEISADGSMNLGPIGRAFQTRLLEATPDVQYYLAEHFALRDHALSCDLGEYLAVPIFESRGLHCVGILELIFTSKGFITQHEVHKIRTAFQIFDLKCLDCQSYEQISRYQPHPRIEIDEMLKVVVQTHQLPFAQIWIPCTHFNPILRNNSHIMLKTTNTNYSVDGYADGVMIFRRACELSHIQIGNAVVGKAFSSRRSCFCIDITNFNCMEYPLVHYAKKCGLTTSFCICLQRCNGDEIYVIEFFLRSSPEGNRGPQIYLLESLVATMKQNLKNFRIASVEGSEDKQFVEVIDFFAPDLYEIWSTVIHPTIGPGTQQNGVETEESRAMTNVCDVVEDDEKVLNVTYVEKPYFKCTSGTGREHRIDRDVLEQHFGMKLEDVAKKFNISKSTLKRVCRQNNILRWPAHKRNKDIQSFPCLEPMELDRRLYTSGNSHLENVADDKVRMHTIKATYGEDIIKFEVAQSCTMLDLEKEIAQRLKLEVGNFNVKYLDEDDDWILLCCNTDLKNCLTTSTFPGRKVVKMLIQP